MSVPAPATASPFEDPSQPPDFEAEERQRIKRMQLRALPVALAGNLTMLVFASVTGRLSMVLPTALGALGFCVALLLVFRNRMDGSTLVIVITAMFLVTEAGLRGDGLRDPAVLAYPVIIIWAGMTLRSRLFFFAAGVVGISATLLAVHSSAEWLVGGETTAQAVGAVLTSAIILVATAYAVWMLANTAREGLTTARTEIQRRHEIEAQLREISMRDALTGLFNRRFFDAEVDRLERTRDTPVSIVVADVDDLKLVNDRRGHAAGDRLLVQIAAALASVIRSEDVLARIGGDEFSILLPGTDEAAVTQAMERIDRKLAEHSAVMSVPLALSLGAATSSDGDLTGAWRLADTRMYAAKAARKALLAEQSAAAPENATTPIRPLFDGPTA